MGRTTVEPAITLQTDHYIKLCKNVLKTRDVQEAARVRREVCNLFEGVIPGWYGGLMAIYTGYYLDDIEMILGKLSIFRSNQMTRSTPRPYRGLTQVVEQIMKTDSVFEQTIRQIEDDPDCETPVRQTLLEKIRLIQRVAESQLSIEEKWALTRPVVHWLTECDASDAARVLPLLQHCIRG